MPTGYYKKKTKKSFKKRLAKGIKISLKKKNKSMNMLVKGIKIFLKKKKAENKNIVANNRRNY